MLSKRSSNKSAASKVAESDDLLIEIFLRMPPKSLIKFKCVSKQWFSFLSDPSFSSSHVRFQSFINKPKPDTILLVDEDESYCSEFEAIPINPNSTGRNIVVKDFLKVPQAKILQSCNGLLLIRSSFLIHPNEKVPQDKMLRSYLFDDVSIDRCSSVASDEDRGYVYFICNPTTGQFKRLSYTSCPLLEKYMRIPYPEYHYHYKNKLVSVCLAFDPTISLHYKIFFIFDCSSLKDPSTYPMDIFIYSSETDSWTSERMELPPPYLETDKMYFCNGSFHWFTCRGRWPALICFDVDKMIFRKIGLNREYMFLGFGEYQRNLYVLCDANYNNLEYDILEIAKDYSTYSVKYHIRPGSITPELCPGLDFSFSSLLHTLCSKNVEEKTVEISVDGGEIIYHLSDGREYKTVCDLKPRQGISIEDCLSYNQITYEHFDSLFCFDGF